MRHKTEAEKWERKRKRITRRSGCLSAVCLILMLGSLGKFLWSAGQRDVLQDDLEERLSFLKSNNRYEAKITRDKAELFEDYKNGEISSEGFEERLEYIGSQDHFIDWARALGQEEVIKINDEYNKQEEKRKCDMYASIGCVGGSLLVAEIAMYRNNKYKNIGEYCK